MTLRLQGIICGGSESVTLNSLSNVSINAPVDGDYLRYFSGSGNWQNSNIGTDVFDFLSTNLLSSGNITITPVVGPNTITLGLTLNDADIVASLGYIPVDRAGDTMTGPLILSGDPVDPFGAATKHYVDNVAAGLTVHPACVTATDSNLSAVYNNGASGVGATLTGSGNLPVISGYSASLGDRILVKDQSNQSENGIYTVTELFTNWVLTRATDFDGSPTSDITAGDLVFVQTGNLAGTQWVQVVPGVINVGSSIIVFEQFAGPGTYSGGTGIDVSGTVISNTGVLSLSGTPGQLTVSSSTGAVTLSLPSNVTGLNSVTATSFIGNASTASTLQTGRTLGVTGDATGTSSAFNGSSNASIPITLATVNTSPQSDAFRKVTVNGKGLVTDTSPVTAGDITALVDGTYVNVTGDTMTGALALTLSANSAQGVSVTNSSSGTTAQSRIVLNNDQADSLIVGVNSSGFTGSGFGNARDSFIRSGLTSTGLYINASSGALRFATGSSDRLQITSSGAWGLSGANYGTSGQVLASNGSGSSPTWQSISGIISGDYVAKTGDTMTGNLIGTSFRAAQGVPNSADLSTNGFAFGSDGDTGMFAPGSGSAAGTVSLYSNNTEVLQASATNGIIGRTFAQFEGGYLKVTQASTAQRLLIGNQDSGGVNNPGMIVGANGTVQLGYGNTWAGNGGTFTSTFQSASSGNTSFVTLTTSGLTVTGQSYFRSALPYAGFSSAATFDYTGSGTEFGITLRPASSAANTNAITFLSSSSTPASPVQLGAIQHLTSNSGLDLAGNWTVNGSSFITTANIASQNVSSANTLSTTRSISATGDANWSVNFNGSANVSSALTLATVNSSPQTDAFVKTTVNGKGLVTATSPVTSSDITGLLGSVYVLKTGDTMTGSLTVSQGSASISINAVNVSSRASTIFRFNGSNRWVVGKLNNPESGSNTGSDFNITRYDDSGNAIDAPVLISRSTGTVTMTNVTATSFNATSTAAVKDRIEDLSPEYLERFNKLRPREYDRTDYVAHEFGFIAEEMADVYPEIVGRDDEGKPSGIDYSKLSTILTAKIMEQQSEIENLKNQVQKILGALGAR